MRCAPSSPKTGFQAKRRFTLTKKRTAQPSSGAAKLDPRLSYLVSLPVSRLKSLKRTEAKNKRALAKDLAKLMQAAANVKEGPSPYAAEIAAKQERMCGSLTAGIYFPGAEQPFTAENNEPYISAFVLCDGSADDLRRLGAQVRSQAGDVFTVFAPRSAITRLQKSVAVRFIELARPNGPTLDEAVPFAGIDQLHQANPAITGANVVVGILDSKIDIYHPDFAESDTDTRILFLWDQTLQPQAGEAHPPTAPALPGFFPLGGTSYGVEYDKAAIDRQLADYKAGGAPYATIRHQPDLSNSDGRHGTHVAGAAVGNGRGDARYKAAAPGAHLIFVSVLKFPDLVTQPIADSVSLADGFAYVFARAAKLGMACVVNRSGSDNQGPHDGTLAGETFLNNLLRVRGRAITLAAGNSNGTASHAAGVVQQGAPTQLILRYVSKTSGGNVDLPESSDAAEIWYDGHDRFDFTLTIPTQPPTTLGPVSPGGTDNVTLPSSQVEVHVVSVVNDGRNGDNVISVVITVPDGQHVPLGDWIFTLTGDSVLNGSFHAWVDRNNRGLAKWESHVREDSITLGAPATAAGPIAVGNHECSTPLQMVESSGRGPTRDGRIKPDIAACGNLLHVPWPRLMKQNQVPTDVLYKQAGGTSISAPLVAGACALLFECRGPLLTCTDIKQILQDTAGHPDSGVPDNGFGFGALQMAAACTAPTPVVDVWLKDHPADAGVEPSAGGIAWLSPDIEILDENKLPVPNPTHDPAKHFNNIVRVTVRNRGSQPARNTAVFLYWAQPATHLPFPAAWRSSGVFTESGQGFVEESNRKLVALIGPGQASQAIFAWAPPPSGTGLPGNVPSCLLVRLENDNDPSQIGDGGAMIITARNNIASRNVHVAPAGTRDFDMHFYVEGSVSHDSFVVESDLVGGQVELRLPVQALPWRDADLLARSGLRARYESPRRPDVLDSAENVLRDLEVERLTDVTGGESLTLRHGTAAIVARPGERLWLPELRIALGARMPASISVRAAEVDAHRRHVHVKQLSDGRILGGLSLEIAL
jgi:hypothetical protein